MAGLRVGVCILAAAAALAGRGARPAHAAGPDIEMPADAPAEVDPDAPPVKDPKAAKKWLAAAKELVARGDALAKKKPEDAKAIYENAATAFEKSLAVGDDIGVSYQLAQVEDKLGKIDAAARHYRIVATAKTGVPTALAKQAQAKLDDALTKLGLVTFTVTPDGATIASGDTKFGKTPLAEPLILMPGSYTLTLTSDGYQPKTTEIKVEAGSESDRKIDLDPIKITVETPPRITATKEPGPTVATAPSKVPMLIGAGVGGALLVTSVFTGLTARSWHNTFVAPMTSKNERLDAHDAGRRYAHITDGCLVGAVVAGGFAAAWYVFKYRKAAATTAETQRIAPKVDMIPWVQPDAGGLGLAGSF